VCNHFSFSSQLLHSQRMAHYDSLCPSQRQQETTCSRTCQSPSKLSLEWVVTRETTRALLQILIPPAAKSRLPSKHNPSPSLLAFPNILKKAKKGLKCCCKERINLQRIAPNFPVLPHLPNHSVHMVVSRLWRGRLSR